jgi:hypothetical protein
MSSIELHRSGAMSGALAASICLAITQLIALIFFPTQIPQNLAYGLSISSVAFGGTYAGVFFISGAIAARRSKAALATN